MRPKRKRMVFVVVGLVLLGAATGLALLALEDNIALFQSPSDLVAQTPPADRAIRLGGLVEEDSVERLADGVTVTFRITDGVHTVPVFYTGLLPNLFREGQGVVAQGRLDTDGRFAADEILAKHDENYMPREVADALKRSGHWQGDEQEQAGDNY